LTGMGMQHQQQLEARRRRWQWQQTVRSSSSHRFYVSMCSICIHICSPAQPHQQLVPSLDKGAAERLLRGPTHHRGAGPLTVGLAVVKCEYTHQVGSLEAGDNIKLLAGCHLAQIYDLCYSCVCPVACQAIPPCTGASLYVQR
jgi:hypothetical protein